MGASSGRHRCPSELGGPSPAWSMRTRGGCGGPPVPSPGRGPRLRLPEQVHAERAPDDDVVADGTVEVTETITWRFPAGEERHGIERIIKVRAGYQERRDPYRDFDMTERLAELDLRCARPTSGAALGAARQIRIGAPTPTITSSPPYVVSYTLAHVVNDTTTTAEFFYQPRRPPNGITQRTVSTERARRPSRRPGWTASTAPRLDHRVRGDPGGDPARSPRGTSPPGGACRCSPPIARRVRRRRGRPGEGDRAHRVPSDRRGPRGGRGRPRPGRRPLPLLALA